MGANSRNQSANRPNAPLRGLEPKAELIRYRHGSDCSLALPASVSKQAGVAPFQLEKEPRQLPDKSLTGFTYSQGIASRFDEELAIVPGAGLELAGVLSAGLFSPASALSESSPNTPTPVVVPT
jgi:hypothetical protein